MHSSRGQAAGTGKAWFVLASAGMPVAALGHFSGLRAHALKHTVMGVTNRQMMQVTKPIFLVGTGRCGSTLFHRLMARHPQMMWLSGFCYLYPDRPVWNRWAVTAMGNPLLHRLFGGKIRPGEHYRFWDHHAYGF